MDARADDTIAAPAIAEVDCAESSLRESVLRHLFLGELLKSLWLKGVRDVDVLQAEVDRGGYDLVLDRNGITRYVQLKSSRRNARTSDVTIGVKLAEKSGGCVIWIWFCRNTLQLGPFLWLGGAPGTKISSLGDKIARHSRASGTNVSTTASLPKGGSRYLIASIRS